MQAYHDDTAGCQPDCWSPEEREAYETWLDSMDRSGSWCGDDCEPDAADALQADDGGAGDETQLPW